MESARAGSLKISKSRYGEQFINFISKSILTCFRNLYTTGSELRLFGPFPANFWISPWFPIAAILAYHNDWR